VLMKYNVLSRLVLPPKKLNNQMHRKVFLMCVRRTEKYFLCVLDLFRNDRQLELTFIPHHISISSFF
jgi:hypothetical protein